MNNELIDQIISNHNKIATIRNSYFDNGIEITVNQEDKKIVIWAFNHKSQRFLNLLAKKYSRLVNAFKDISLNMNHKEHYVYFTLNSEGYNAKETVSNKTYGYARVSTKSQEDNTSLENQINILKDNGCTEIFSEVCSGATMERPQFVELDSKLKNGDILVITKLDRFTRSTEKGIEKIRELAERGIKVNILNMGMVDLSNPIGKMVFTVLSSFAEYERDCIVERMKDGKEIAKQDPSYREGRPPIYSKKQIEHAIELLDTNTYRQVEQLTGISKSTLIRAKRK